MPFFALVCALALSTPAGAAVTVRVEGAVAHAGTQRLADGARVADALNAAQVSPDAYVLGAAWLRPSLRREQTRLKTAALYDLGLLQAQARLDGRNALADVAGAMLRRLRAMPVTGRQVPALLDPRPLEISEQNHLLAAGDRIVYPTRPTRVRVLGAVQRACSLPLVPLQAARAYLRACPLAAAADPDWLYVIQPDGRVQRQGIAAWNRDTGQALAPGAVIYVPVRAKAWPDLVRAAADEDITGFLATQVLPGMSP
jgi:protein involved in polysaccharide export with SLBB domain